MFVSNFYFWQDINYFAAPAEANPLLHTWSLAVEEQFYILFPIFIFLVSRLSRKLLLPLVFILCLLSFALSIYLSEKSPAFSFYLLPTRAWELGIGASLAIFERDKHPIYNIRGPSSYLGVLLIAASIALLTPRSIFPGWVAAIPCIGAALIIACAEGNQIGKALSLAPVVWVGKISYSLYLWHWPIIVFWKSYSGEHLSLIDKFGIGICSILLSWISTSFIESKFRSNSVYRLPARSVVFAGGTSSLLLALFGYFGSHGLLPDLRPYSPDILALERVSGQNYTQLREYSEQFREGTCFLTSGHSFSDFAEDKCMSLSEDKPNILLIGDSFGAHLWGALQQEYPSTNVLQATASGCRPLLESPGQKQCTDMRDWVYSEYISSHHLDAIMLSARWREENLPYLEPTLIFLESLNTNVILVGPTIEYKSSLPDAFAQSLWNNYTFDFKELTLPEPAILSEKMKQIAIDNNVTYIDVLDTLCSTGGCALTTPDGQPLQFDYSHFTLSGAKYMISESSDVLDDIIGNSR